MKIYQNFIKIVKYQLFYYVIKKIDEYYLEFYSTIYNTIINKIILNDEIVKNQFDLPSFEGFHFNINIPFNFQTFFKYDINLKFIEESSEPIIGGPYHSIFIKKLIRNNSENWVTTTNFSLTYIKFNALCYTKYNY